MLINIDSETSGFVRAKLVYRRPPSLRKNRERRRRELKRTSLHLVRFKIFEWIKYIRRLSYIKFRETELVEIS